MSARRIASLAVIAAAVLAASSSPSPAAADPPPERVTYLWNNVAQPAGAYRAADGAVRFEFSIDASLTEALPAPPTAEDIPDVPGLRSARPDSFELFREPAYAGLLVRLTDLRPHAGCEGGERVWAQFVFVDEAPEGSGYVPGEWRLDGFYGGRWSSESAYVDFPRAVVSITTGFEWDQSFVTLLLCSCASGAVVSEPLAVVEWTMEMTAVPEGERLGVALIPRATYGGGWAGLRGRWQRLLAEEVAERGQAAVRFADGCR